VAKFQYLGTAVTNGNFIQKEIESRLNWENACNHSVQNLLCSRLVSKNVKIKIYKTIIPPVILSVCRTCYLTLKEEYRLGVHENRVRRTIFGRKREEVIAGWRKIHNEEPHNLYSSRSVIRVIKSRRN
jgi:hypothetical protein